MKFSIPVTCPACDKEFSLEISGSDIPDYKQCPKCETRSYNLWPLGNLVTILLMERAKQELANGDVTVALLLSSMAVEGQMSWLFFKWKGLDSGKFLGNETLEVRKQWEDEWSTMRSIGKRMDELSRFLTKRPFDEFASMRKEVITPAIAGHDAATSIKEFFQRHFFEKRNAIVHYGEIDFQEADGERCLSLARVLLILFHAMDALRCDVMEETFRQEREETRLSKQRSDEQLQS